MSNCTRENRINVIKILYNIEFNNDTVKDIASRILEVADDIAISYATEIKNELESIDNIISDSLVNYSIIRLNLVDKAIVRLATYEMKSGLAPSLAINEAIEITKEYSDSGDKRAVAFNNRLLDNIKIKLGK